MVDSRFFANAGSITLQAVATLTGAVIATRNNAPVDPVRVFTNVASLDNAGATDISFLDNTKYIDAFSASKAGACFVRPKFAERAPKDMVLLVSEDPYYCYAITAAHFYPMSSFEAGVSPHAVIAKTAAIGKGARIDSGAVIGEGVRIGDRSWIGANTVVGDSVEIGPDSRVGANCTLSHTIIGARAIIHRGVHIGQDGFGFAPSKRGIVKVPQLGRVIIADDVEIGSGTCIDRGAGPDTTIGQSSKIDNLVQIGHNVQIGRFVVIAAQCGIAGSTIIGDGAMFGGQVGVAGHLNIGPGAKFAAKTGVMTDIPAGSTYGGSPGIPIKEWHRQTLAMARMTKRKLEEQE